MGQKFDTKTGFITGLRVEIMALPVAAPLDHEIEHLASSTSATVTG